MIEIEGGAVTGTMSRRALRLILEWYDRHRDELQANWERARNREPLEPIEPLP